MNKIEELRKQTEEDMIKLLYIDLFCGDIRDI